MRRVHDLLDGVSAGSREWGDARFPAPLRELADQTWEQISGARSPQALDAARAAYIDLYEHSEAIAYSSVVGVRRGKRAPAKSVAVAGPAARAARMVPRGVRRRVPVRWRRRMLGALRR
jgi:hypothetical protein